ncbi:hypothetical protein A8F94_07555 [Bacillus sp. FJAT-27225]|uniref:hypothetical protein n=1 Tax=Bacillus sp. FJAT-27225 TaxID=1743144 RepID=UPI00080C327B|nr:hypothetical protein [Bacillus sp. FJAT-27225]OCA87702.1 hypothetical protein A8F94_07555 [Bacillus sp. FJAT-27225]
MQEIQSLTDFVSKADGARQATLYINERELPKEGSPLGDEDSTAGDGVKVKMELTLDTGSEKHTFEKEYRDDLLYQEDMKLINELREKVPVVNGKPS